MDQTIDLLDSAAKRYPIKALCDEIGKAQSTLRNELTRQEGYKLGLDTSILIMTKTGDLSALDRIEGMFKRVAFSLPDPDPDNIKPIMKLVAKLSKEFGESMSELAQAMADGKIKPKEAVKCLKENQDLIAACLQVQAYLEQFVK